MKMEEARLEFAEIQKKMMAYKHAMGVLRLDSVTVAPSDTAEGRGITKGVLTEANYEIQNGERTKEVLAFLNEHQEELNDTERRQLEYFNREKALVAKVPKEEYVAYQVMLNEAAAVWHRAKKENDFPAFAPYLEKIIDTQRHFAQLNFPDRAPYDVMLSRYEYGLTMEKADVFFDQVRASVVPLLGKVVKAKQPEAGFLGEYCPVWKQRKFSEYLMEVLGVDRTHCAIGETEHPFTMSFNKKDCRVTTHYYENDLTSSMFSTIHECGHALYGMNSGDEYEWTNLRGGISMGVHESQSRLYENLVGRSEEFLGLILPKLQEMFPEQFAQVTPRMLYEAVNRSEPSLIRIYADELTYPLHIMVRYDLEKALVGGSLSVSELPQAWAAKMKEYLGIEAPDDSRGVLQDSHWSSGQIGYFPSYALGSAYGAQMISKMNEYFDVKEAVSKGEIPKLTAWLTERIYRHGRRYDPEVIVEMACEAKFDPKYYTDYLEKKYTDIYQLG